MSKPYIEPLEGRTLLSAMLVKDIRPGAAPVPDSTVFGPATVMGGRLYFTARDETGGDIRVWKTDGTAAGTHLVNGSDATKANDPTELTAVNGSLFFASNYFGMSELWKTDGSTEGTSRIWAYQVPNFYGRLHDLESYGNRLFFSNFMAGSGQELWTSDGTPTGTVLFKDINPNGDSSPANLTVVNGVLFFTATNGVNGDELWKSDGTAAGTVMVKDVNPGGGDSLPRNLTVVNGQLYFTADNGVNGRELWRSDGTAAGTVLVKDITTGPVSSFSSSLFDNSPLTALGSVLYFEAGPGNDDRELWKSDGTAAGTVLVRDIAPGTASSRPGGFTAINGFVLFSADDGVNGRELWRSDGTTTGTAMVKEIRTGVNSSWPWGLTAINGVAVFAAEDGLGGRELWKSDGTAAGTVPVVDLNPGMSSSSPEPLGVLNGSLLFSADEGISGRELWRTDGTAVQTFQVRDLDTGHSVPAPHNSDPWAFANIDGVLYFTADNGMHGRELWKSDGTAAGTFLIKDIVAGPDSSWPSYLTNVDGTLFFTTYDTNNGRELWKSDGTAAGTVLVKDIYPGSSVVGGVAYANSSNPSELVNVNGTLYFAADDGLYGKELWRSDGTAAGTILVKDVYPGSTVYNGVTYMHGSSPSHLVQMNGTLYFGAYDGMRSALWRSDGTAVGTVLVKDIFPRYDSGMAVAAGTLFIGAHNGGLWKSDGTTSGTVQVSNVMPGPMADVGGTLFFAGDDGVNGTELWKSDGTAAGTVLVKDVATGTTSNPNFVRPISSSPSNLTVLNGALYFTTSEYVEETWLYARDISVWKSDGTSTGTVQVSSLFSPFYGYYNHDISYTSNLTGVGGDLYFTRTPLYYVSPYAIKGLWRSDGTASGTTPVPDLFPGDGEADFDNLIDVNGTLFVTANDGNSGRELWSYPAVASTADDADSSFAATGPWSVAYGGGFQKAVHTTTAGSGQKVATWRFAGLASGAYRISATWAAAADRATNARYTVADGPNGPPAAAVVNQQLAPTGITDAGVTWQTLGTFTINSGVAVMRLSDLANGVVVADAVRLERVNAGTISGQVYREINGNGARDVGEPALAGWTLYLDANDNSALDPGESFAVSDAAGHYAFSGLPTGQHTVRHAPPPTGWASITPPNGFQSVTLTASKALAAVDFGATGISPTVQAVDDGDAGFSTTGAWITTAGAGRQNDVRVRAGGIGAGTATWTFPDLMPALYRVSASWTAETDRATNAPFLVFNGEAPQYPVVSVDQRMAPSDFTDGGTAWRDLGTYWVDMGMLKVRLSDAANGVVVADAVRVERVDTGSTLSVLNVIGPEAPWDQQPPVRLNGFVYFRGYDAAGGWELWKSDGTVSGTSRVKNIHPGVGSSDPSDLTVFNGLLYFRADNGTHGRELWRSNGTAAGTVMVKDIAPGSTASGPNSSHPAGFTVFDGLLFFRANDGVNGSELWKSDGTDAGTVLVKDIYPGGTFSGPNSSYPESLTPVGSTLFFVVHNDGATGNELWKTDGTAAGTVLVKDIRPGSSSGFPYGSYPRDLFPYGETLIFVAADAESNYELWKSDGTAAGTLMLRDILPGNLKSSHPSEFTALNGAFYFSATDATAGRELWRSDGTAAGTVLVKDIAAGAHGGGPRDSSPRSLAVYNGAIYFAADDGVNGSELWRTDGTAAGTVLVRDLNLGMNDSTPVQFTVVGGALFFTADDGRHAQLWKSDGTAAGTVPVGNVAVFDSATRPTSLTGLNDEVLFTSHDSTLGMVLWKAYSPPAARVFDDAAPGGFRTTGTWAVHTGTGFDGGYRSRLGGNGANEAIWSFPVIPGQTYRVAVTWPAGSDRADNAPFRVEDGSRVLGTVAINQRIAPNDFIHQGAGWKDLGGTYLVAGNKLRVVLSDAANGIVAADAVRIERVTPSLPGTLSIEDAVVTEGSSGTRSATFAISLSAASVSPVTVWLATAAGSAQAGADFMPMAPTTLTFAPGELTKQVSVAIVGDVLDEADETFFIDILSASGAPIARGRATGTILDDDATPTVKIVDLKYKELASGSKQAKMKLTLSAPSGRDVSIDYLTTNGTATAGSDYSATSGTLVIPAGQTVGYVLVSVTGDTTPEWDETLLVNFSNPSNVGFALVKGVPDSQGLITILNDDTTIGITGVARAEGTGGTTAFTFTVSLSTAVAFPVTVKYKTVDATAIAGSDYVAAAGTLSFAAGETSKTITVLVYADTTVEADETFNVTLSTSTNAIVKTKTGIGTIQNDDAALRLARGTSAARRLGRALDRRALARIADAVVGRWKRAGLDPVLVARLRSVRFRVSNLEGDVLGVASGNVIHLDRTAAGAGWFLDRTPSADSEFRGSTRPSSARDRVDLVTVIAHELGHVLGLEHTGRTGDIMGEALRPGWRYVPRASDLAGLKPQMTQVTPSERQSPKRSKPERV